MHKVRWQARKPSRWQDISLCVFQWFLHFLVSVSYFFVPPFRATRQLSPLGDSSSSEEDHWILLKQLLLMSAATTRSLYKPHATTGFTVEQSVCASLTTPDWQLTSSRFNLQTSWRFLVKDLWKTSVTRCRSQFSTLFNNAVADDYTSFMGWWCRTDYKSIQWLIHLLEYNGQI